ncbi:MAG TPA: hypothetical protein VE954_33550 [Oligoflexus sp.]|uniref:hypothetical protein n=1 Tax=Oligoflexus sp. TaxID=1971216 RepID=UPI002D28186E|nr:hypothetical protein [Oligoflexus sp.]HYX38054.1 hypothetical protein [Oligoflexus sp.]
MNMKLLNMDLLSMKTYGIILSAITLFSSVLYADALPSGYDVTTLPSHASYANFETMLATKAPGNVSQLCPASKAEYGASIDEIQTKIDGINPSQCYLSIPMGFGGGSRCVWRGSMIIKTLEDKRYPTELCYELHTLQEAYDLALVNGASLSAEGRQRMNNSLDGLGQCLKAATRRTEIENCYVSFRAAFEAILAE